MLLFKEGDPYSASLAAESARMLRGLGIMNPVNITAHRVDGGVDVMVETRDQWTLKAGAKLGVFGSNASYRVDFEEENLLGWGKAVSVAYESDNERNSWSLGYFDPNVFNSRWRVNLVHATYSDGFHDEVVVDRPFYSLTTPVDLGSLGSSAGADRSPLLAVGVGRGRPPREREAERLGRRATCPAAATSRGASSPAGNTARISTPTGSGTTRTRPTHRRRIASSAVPASPTSRSSIASSWSRASGRGRSRRTFPRAQLQPDHDLLRPHLRWRPPTAPDGRSSPCCGPTRAMAAARRHLVFGSAGGRCRPQPGGRDSARRRPARHQRLADSPPRRGLTPPRPRPAADSRRRSRSARMGPRLLRWHRARDPQCAMAQAPQKGGPWFVLGRRRSYSAMPEDLGSTGRSRTRKVSDSTPAPASSSTSPISVAAPCLRIDAAIPDDGTGVTVTVSTSTIFELPERWR